MTRPTIINNVRGAAAIEYALVAALIAVAGIMAFQRTGDGVAGSMSDVSGALPSPSTGSNVPPIP